MDATVLLCDYAEAVNGKLYVMGGGWNVAFSSGQPINAALAILVIVPWDQTNRRHELRVELVDGDGNVAALAAAQPVAERRHSAAAVAHLLDDLAVVDVGVVEIGADLAVGVRRAQGVAVAAARLVEHLASGLRIRAGGHGLSRARLRRFVLRFAAAPTAAARERERRDRECESEHASHR